MDLTGNNYLMATFVFLQKSEQNTATLVVDSLTANECG